MSNRRIERVSKLVKEQVGEILEVIGLTDCGFITVTAANISPDLKEGRIYVSVIGTLAQQKRALVELSHRHGDIQHELARRIIIKYTPRLTFHLDETETHAARIEQLLNDVNEEPKP